MNTASAAGFWIRALALVIDCVVFAVVGASYDLAASLAFGVDPARSWGAAGAAAFFTLVFVAVYTTVLHATGGQTIGKLVAGVRVVAFDGEPPRGGAAFLRWLGYFVSCATLGFGFLMAGLRTDKRALHDLIAGTRVERVARTRPRAEPSAPAEAAPPAPTEPATPVP